MPGGAPLRVLVIDDDADTCENLRDILEMDNYQVETAGSVAAGLECAGRKEMSAIILDRRLPDGTAEDVLPQLKRLAPEAAVLIVTGYADLEGAIAALRLGAADYILKPINPAALRASLSRIAERQRLQWEKEHTEAALRTLIEAAPCMILILRGDHATVYFSPFSEQLTGYRRNDILGKDYLQTLVPEGHRQAVADDIRHVLAGIPTRGFEYPVVCRDGSQRWMVWNAQRLTDYEGGPAVLAVGQDITRLKQAQDQALQAERLAAIGQMVTGLAHESGNALARSRACLEMLTWEVQDLPEARDLIARIQNAQDHLQHLYEEVRGYAAPLKLERESWHLDVVWRQAWTNLALLRQNRDATLREHAAGADLTCSVDQFRLEQVFRNIFENSLAACPDPMRIDIRCAEARLDSRPAVRVSVRDNGPGLTPEQRQRIFDPFFTTKTKGTGLGMAIAKRIVEAHGGRIAVGASSEKGAEIVLTLPRESP